jgi:preprotein translocase subunit SecE
MESTMSNFSPLQFLREVRQEGRKVTWPTRKETLVSTGMVFLMVLLAAVFFFVVDQILQIGVKQIFRVGM